jgi:hypothetical protein
MKSSAVSADMSPLSLRLLWLGWITVALYILVKLSNELQKVYLLCGTIRSPMYSDQGR